MQSKTIRTMKWDEFKSLLAGIGPKTALGRMVSIRAENDAEMLKHFTPEMRKIRSNWMNRNAKQRPEEEVERFLESMKKAFIDMAGR